MVGTVNSAAAWLDTREAGRPGDEHLANDATRPREEDGVPPRVELRVVIDEADLCLAGVQKKGGKATKR